MQEVPDFAPLLGRRSEFIQFLASRLGGNREDAEDLLQVSLTKALRSSRTLQDHTKLVPWFYQLLRNTIIDHVRARQAGIKRDEAWMQEILATKTNDLQRQVCRCFESLLPLLKPVQAELLRRVELQEEKVADVAHALGVSTGNASVLLHRARKELRVHLENFCRNCATRACLDCDCGERL